MAILDSFIPSDAPAHARETLRHDVLAALGRGTLLVGGAGTAAVIAKKAFGADDFLVALLFSAAHAGQIGAVWAPRLVDRFGAIRFIFAVELATAALMVASGFSPGGAAFVLVLSVAYTIRGLATPAFSRVYRQNYPTVMRGRLFSITSTAANAALAVVGYAVGQALNAAPESYRVVLPMLGVAGALGAFAFRRIRVRDEHTAAVARGPGHLRALGRIIRTDRRYTVFLAIWAIFGFSNLMLDPVRAIYVSDDRFGLGTNYLQSLLILVVIPQVTIMLSLRVWGALLDRWPVVLLRVFMQVFALINVVIFIATPRIEWLYVAGIFRGFAMAGGHITWPLALMEFAPRQRVSEYTAIHTLFTGVRGIFAPQVAAVMLALVGPIATFEVGLAGIALSVTLFALFPRITANWPVPDGAPQPRQMPLSTR